MHLVFIRHGHYDGKKYRTAAEKAAGPLTARGEEDARSAGMYLGEHAIRPDFVLRTDTERTRQTAQLVLEELGMAEQPVINVGTAFQNLAGLDTKLREWSGAHGISDDSVVFLVGHGNAQDILRKCFEGEPLPPTSKKSYAAALSMHVPAGGRPEGRGFYAGRPK